MLKKYILLTGHFACSAISEYVLNTASRTFFPAGWSITANVATVANLFIKDLFTFAVFARGMSQYLEKISIILKVSRIIC